MKQLMTAAILILVGVILVGVSALAPSAVAGQTAPLGRDAVMRECNAQASKTYALRDSNWSVSAYRACMAEHGEAE